MRGKGVDFMYELMIKSHFDAAHSLRGYPGPCRELHGHTWNVEVIVAGNELDEIDLIYDFKELKDQVNKVLSKFDHKHLNEIPPFDKLSPTGENLARYLFKDIKRVLPDRVFLKKVNVWESPEACITYYED